jgi:hypothetical protein
VWRLLGVLIAGAALLAPGASLANDDVLSGLWRVTGKIASVDFGVTCRLDRHGESLDGACIEDHTGKAHPLTGVVDGDKVTWSHKKKFLMMTLNIVYSAIFRDGAMHGELSAAGHSGPFTAARL